MYNTVKFSNKAANHYFKDLALKKYHYVIETSRNGFLSIPHYDAFYEYNGLIPRLLTKSTIFTVPYSTLFLFLIETHRTVTKTLQRSSCLQPSSSVLPMPCPDPSSLLEHGPHPRTYSYPSSSVPLWVPFL